jgi:hypothetical protein
MWDLRSVRLVFSSVGAGDKLVKDDSVAVTAFISTLAH